VTGPGPGPARPGPGHAVPPQREPSPPTSGQRRARGVAHLRV